MADTCFIDTNVLMYAVGTEHPLKQPSLKIIEKVSLNEIVAVTDTEVFQEVAYRYWHQGKWPLAAEVLRTYESLFDEILPVERKHLKSYYRLLSDHDFLSPRDAIHIAVMRSHSLRNICTSDQVFKRMSDLTVCFPL